MEVVDANAGLVLIGTYSTDNKEGGLLFHILQYAKKLKLKLKLFLKKLILFQKERYCCLD